MLIGRAAKEGCRGDLLGEVAREVVARELHVHMELGGLFRKRLLVRAGGREDESKMDC